MYCDIILTMPHSTHSTTELHPTSFARLVHERIPAGASIAVLGAAQNDDALWFASQGHLVTAVCSVDTTGEEAERQGSDAVHTLVMDGYNFHYAEVLQQQNATFAERLAALGLTIPIVHVDWNTSHLQIPLQDQSIDVLYAFAFSALFGLEGFTPAVGKECHRVIRSNGWFATVQYGVQESDDLTNCVEEQPGVYRHNEYGTVLYRTTVEAVEKSTSGLFEPILLEETTVTVDDWTSREFAAPFRAVRYIGRRQ